MKKAIVLLTLLALSLYNFSCGGAGSSSSPSGQNPGIPSVVKLLPSQSVAQTNSYIYLYTKVLDGNGIPVPNTPVTFTNLSPIGVLIPTSANTDASGIATVTLKSTTTGFSTVQAEVNTGAGQIRNRKTVYFSIFDLTLPSPPAPSLTIHVDDGDGIPDEDDDFNLFKTADDNQRTITAVVLNSSRNPVPSSLVTFGADSTEASFPLGSTKTTNSSGEAFVLVRVDPIEIRNIQTVLNITAVADNGAANMVSLFLQPVTVSASSSSLSANPTAVNPGGTSALTAVVKLSTGAVAPDGTTVNFTTTCGTVTPFAQTTDGVAAGTFTAPVTEGSCTVTATAGGVTIGSVPILVNTALKVIPDTVGVAIAGTATVRVFGGIPNYTIISGSPATATVAPASLTASGQSFIVTGVAMGVTTITVRDAAGTTVTVAVTVSTTGGGGGGTGIPMSISPLTATVAGIKNPDTSTVDDLQFVLSNMVSYVNCISSHPAIIASPGASIYVNFTVDPDEVAVTTPVTITCTDADGFVASALVTVTPPGLAIRLNPIHVIGRANPPGGDGDITDDVLVEVIGGVGPYIVNIEPFSLTTIVPGGPWPSAVPWTFLVDPTNVITNTVVMFKVTDGIGTTASANLVVYTENTGLVANTSKENVIGLANNPDGNTADDVTITVSGANNPFIVSWVCSCGLPGGICATPASPVVVAGTSGTVIFDPDANTGIIPKACTVNVTDNLGSAATLNVTVWP